MGWGGVVKLQLSSQWAFDTTLYLPIKNVCNAVTILINSLGSTPRNKPRRSGGENFQPTWLELQSPRTISLPLPPLFPWR